MADEPDVHILAMPNGSHYVRVGDALLNTPPGLEPAERDALIQAFVRKHKPTTRPLTGWFHKIAGAMKG